MLKKLLSVLLATTVVLTSLLSAIMLTVSADTLSAGVYPYATNGVKTPIITHKTGEEATAFNDFFAKQTIDSLTDENYFNTFKPYGHLVKDEVVSNKTLISASLDSYSDSADNVYGSAGKSYKATYIKATNSSIKPANFDTAQNFHYVRVTNTMIISSDCKDTASVGFWVKSTHQTFIVVRLSANTNGTESFIISDRFLIPAGESFVEIPLSNFVTANSGYHPLREATGDIRIYNTDIFFKSTESFEGTRDIWFDNIGYYNYASKTDKALHSSDAILKNNVENYIQDGTAVKKDGVTWNADSKGSVTVSNPVSGTANLNAYNGNGQSIHYSTTQASTTAYNRFRNNGKVNTNNADGDPTGVNATLAVWIKTDRAIKIFLTADDSTVANSGRNRYQSSEYFLPAGETMLEIPVSDFDTQYVIANQTVDNQFVWDYLGCINFYFKSAVNNGNPNANVWVDSIAIIPGQIEDIPESSEESSSAESSSEESSSDESSSEDTPVSSEPSPTIPDTKATHGEGFVEVTLKPENWVNKITETSAFECDTNAAYSHASDKSAYKLTYSNISSTVNLINFYYNSRIYINGTAPYIFDEDSVFSFWVRADQPMAISVTYMDHDNVSNAQTQNGLKTINIPAGESIVRINMAEMTKAGCEFDYRYLFQLQFKINSTEDSYKTSGEIYFDSFGFYDADPTNNIPPAPELPEVPDTKVTHTEDFFEAALKNDKWVNKKTESSTFALDENAAYSHGSDKNAYKLSYSNISANENLLNFYYDEKLFINGIAPYIYDEDSVLSFWMRADQPVTLRITYLDYNNLTDKYAQSLIRTVNVPAGESIVKIDMKDMCPDGVSYDYRYAYQLQIQVRANEESYKTSGEIYFDSFGFYDMNPSNEIPPKPQAPEIPDTKVTHDVGFVEIEPDPEQWITKKADNVVISIDDSAVRYHSGKTNVADNSSALKISYKNLSASMKNVSFYSESRIQLSNTAPCIYGENSILSFWVYTEQAVDLKVAYRDYSNTAGKSVQCKEMTISIPIGESIVKIPMKDCVPADNDMDYRFAYQLQISVLANDDSYKNSGDILFDAFGFYDSELVINDKPLTMPENTFVWWNFDNGDTLEEIPDEWTARWAGEEGKGIIVTLEKDSDNVYGSKGNSLKIDYVRALGEYTAPNIWLEKRTATMGDGIVFWIKSEQKTNIRILCLDANVDAIEMLVPVTIGYNIVEVKWSDFTYTDKTKTGKPATNSIAQLQLRPMGASGTFWLDQIGFLNVKNDGSNAYNSVYPPTSYKDWEDGNVSGGDGFDNWPSDDDFGFCTEWYFQDTGWITLPKIGNNTVLKMDYNRTNGKRSELVNITEFKDIDPKGGISFWAKSTEARYYTLRISIGTQIIAVNFMGDTNGRTYNIPFSAFWINGRIDKDYIPSSTKGVSVTKLQFVSDETCNPPATGALSDKFSLYLDDIKFVDSLGFLRAADIDYTENGVTLKAAMNAFSVGVIPKITKTELTDAEKQEYLKLAETATEVIALYNIVASDKDGKVQIPTAAVELIFDVPEGIDANVVQVYQVYLDGSLSKRPVTVTEDGRVSTSVFRLGEYLLAWGEVTSKPQVEDDTPVDTPEQPTQESGFWWLIAIIAAVILAGAVVVVVFVRKGRGK